MNKKDSLPVDESTFQVRWGKKAASSPFLPLIEKPYDLSTPLFVKTAPLEGYQKTMSAPLPTVPYMPPALPAGVAPPKGLALPVEKSSFLFLALGLMVLGICFFIAGFLFSLWVQKTVPSTERSVISHTQAGIAAQTAHLVKDRVTAVSSAASHAVSPVSTPLPAEATEKSSSQVSPESEMRYAIQLGAFVTRENATDLVDKLKARQIASSIHEEQDASGAPLFCVRTTNEFATYKAAESAAGSLFHQEAISAFVVPIASATKKS